MSVLTVELIRAYNPFLDKPRPAFNTKQEAILNTAPDKLGKMAIVDVETTDLELLPVEITEFAVQVYLYNKETKQMLSEGVSYNEMNEPSDVSKITPLITKITGIVAADVIGKKIDWDHVNTILSDVDFVIAHNAKFDKSHIQPFLTSEKVWLCSFKGVQWSSKIGLNNQDAPNNKLEILCLHYGQFTYSGHRALEDVKSTGQLLDQMNILGEMIVNGTKVTAIIEGFLDAYKMTYIKDIVTGKNKERAADFGYIFKSCKEAKADEPGKFNYWYEVANLTEEQADDLAAKLKELFMEFNPKGIDKVDFYTKPQSY